MHETEDQRRYREALETLLAEYRGGLAPSNPPLFQAVYMAVLQSTR